MSRTLSPYEKNHLIRHGIDPQSVAEDDEAPVEYLTGWVDFCGHTFAVSADALIPRIETEELVAMAAETAVEMALDSEQKKVLIADVGTGSGAAAISLGLSLIDQGKSFAIYASDISAQALKLAKKNQSRLLDDKVLQENHSQVSFIESNLLDDFPEIKFDILLANLPYIPSERIEYLDSSVKDFEPKIALDGGQSGFELISKFLKQAPAFLKTNGVVLLELDYTHDESVFADLANTWRVELIRDGFNKQRFAKLRLK